MKRLVYLFGLLVILMIACESEDVAPEYESQGLITGPDYRRCACCGGYFIEIEGEVYRFYEFPTDEEHILIDFFPVYVKLNWSPDPEACLGDEILIEEIMLDQIPD